MSRSDVPVPEQRAVLPSGLRSALRCPLSGEELVDGAPKPVKENVGKAEAEELKGKLEEAGATVELK